MMRKLIVTAVTIIVALGPLIVLSEERKRDVLADNIGREVAIAVHLAEDDEFTMPLTDLLAYGRKLFEANWTEQDGAGRPLTKGTGRQLSDPSEPLVGARAMNRISGPDSNSCAGCHNAPYGIPGGGGDFVTNVFVLGQRFDFVTFDDHDPTATKASLDERGKAVSLQTVANLRSTTGMFGSGYLEMLAREMTADLQSIRDTVRPGETKPLVSKGISFGDISRKADGLWDVSKVEGLSRLSLLTASSNDPPTLIIRPWHQAGNVISLREFTLNAYNHHHGIQAVERFGRDTDPDGDGVVNEMTRADVTAVTVYQAAMAAPGRVIPANTAVENAVHNGEELFTKIGCASCHVPSLPLKSTIYSEPNPYNERGNLRTGDAKPFRVDLNDERLPLPRLHAQSAHGPTMVAAFTDFKLHDITSGPDDPNAEALYMNFGVWAPKFASGNRKFLTKRLWGAANEPPFYHHGRFTTMRQAVLAHSGEALAQRKAFEALTKYDRDSVIEFLKTLQVLPPGTKDLVVDEQFHKREWP